MPSRAIRYALHPTNSCPILLRYPASSSATVRLPHLPTAATRSGRFSRRRRRSHRSPRPVVSFSRRMEFAGLLFVCTASRRECRGAKVRARTVKCYEFAEIQYEYASICRRAINDRPYIIHGTWRDKHQFETQTPQKTHCKIFLQCACIILFPAPAWVSVSPC